MLKFRDLDLTSESSFSVLAQYAVEKYYLIPYGNPPLGKEIPAENIINLRKAGKIPRKFHGGVHACSTAINIDLFIALYNKYKPELLRYKGAPLSEQDIKLLKLAAIYHDSANINENKGTPEKHADNFRRDMYALGFNKLKVDLMADAIINKDSKETKNIFQKLIHDADCLDIIRVVGDKFDKTRLDIFQDLKSNVPFIAELLPRIITNHQQTLKYFYPTLDNKVSVVQQRCEFSDNCYEKLLETYQNLLRNHIITISANENKALAPRTIDLSTCTIIDLFNRIHCKKQKFIQNAIDVLELIKKRKAAVKIIRNLHAKSEDPNDICEDFRWEYLIEEIINPLINRIDNRENITQKHVFDFETNEFKEKPKSTNQNPQFTLKTPFSLLPKHGNMILFNYGVGILCDLDKTKISSFLFKKNAKSVDKWWRYINDQKAPSKEEVLKRAKKSGKLKSLEELNQYLEHREKELFPITHDEILLGINKDSLQAIVMHFSEEFEKNITSLLCLKLIAISRYHYIKTRLNLDLPIIMLAPNRPPKIYSLAEQHKDIEKIKNDESTQEIIVKKLNDISYIKHSTTELNNKLAELISLDNIIEKPKCLVTSVQLNNTGEFCIACNTKESAKTLQNLLRTSFEVLAEIIQEEKVYWLVIDTIDAKKICQKRYRHDFSENILIADESEINYWEKYFLTLFNNLLEENHTSKSLQSPTAKNDPVTSAVSNDHCANNSTSLHL